jgi:hypothetical protein
MKIPMNIHQTDIYFLLKHKSSYRFQLVVIPPQAAQGCIKRKWIPIYVILLKTEIQLGYNS